jgi:hypothetical protein
VVVVRGNDLATQAAGEPVGRTGTPTLHSTPPLISSEIIFIFSFTKKTSTIFFPIFF